MFAVSCAEKKEHDISLWPNQKEYLDLREQMSTHTVWLLKDH